MNKIVGMALSLFLLAPGCGGPGTIDTSPIGGAVVKKIPLVRVAELEIDPRQLEAYKAAVKEEMETSVREEPGVLAIYAVAEKDDLSKLRFFEMYADEAAYKAHLGSPHFRKYVAITKDMITSRKLIEAVPVQLSEKKR